MPTETRETEKSQKRANWLKKLRARNLAIACGLICFALLFYFITLAKLGMNLGGGPV